MYVQNAVERTFTGWSHLQVYASYARFERLSAPINTIAFNGGGDLVAVGGEDMFLQDKVLGQN